MSNEDRFTRLVERYNRFIEPLENWATSDIVELIEVLDCELQQRAPETAGLGELTAAEQDEYGRWSDRHFPRFEPIEDEL